MTHREWLFSLTNHERKLPGKYTETEFSTARYASLLAALGDPHLAAPTTVHILGTDGKGSTLAFLEALLNLCGRKTCAFISPHLIQVEERFRVDGRPVASKEMDDCMGRVRVHAERIEGLTFFEALNAAFWLWVQALRPDFVLLETGLGGRLDTTRICRPTLKILTHVDRDHIKLLGRTIERIAWEKLSGLSAEAVTLVARQSPFLRTQVEDFLEENQMPAVWVEDSLPLDVCSRSPQRWGFRSPEGIQLGSTLIGDHQRRNLASALVALDVLGLSPSGDCIELRPNWPGRCQWLQQAATTYFLDGSHTAVSGQALRLTLDQIDPDGPSRTFWVACSADRFPWCYLRGLVRPDDTLHLVRTDHPRLWNPDQLRNRLDESGWWRHPLPPAQVHEGERAFDGKGRGIQVVCGSLYWVGSALNRLQTFRAD